jgi:hypothetical protein
MFSYVKLAYFGDWHGHPKIHPHVLVDVAQVVGHYVWQGRRMYATGP